MEWEPGYLSLYRSGELGKRVQNAIGMLSDCNVCPHRCGVDRTEKPAGVCQSGRHLQISTYFAHFGEEPCIRGTRGSGTIFFSRCNLHCIYCQNIEVSRDPGGLTVSAEGLARVMMDLQKQGCHNINLVTPDHVVPQILEALEIAIPRGLHLPLIYNTSSYITEESLALLDGVIDIYLADLKSLSPDKSRRYLHAANYPEEATRSILEMHRQVGNLSQDDGGVAFRGLMIRHLVMPEGREDWKKVFGFIAEQLSTHTYISILDSYTPSGEVGPDRFPELNRRISPEEMELCMEDASRFGLKRIDCQARRVTTGT